jgi:uncharacterized membrane protein YadS
MSNHPSQTNPDADPATSSAPAHGAQDWWQKEDWWAVWIGLGFVLTAYVFFMNGSSMSWLAVSPKVWTSVDALRSDLGANAGRYAALFGVFLTLFTGAATCMGHRAKAFIPSFAFLFILSVLIVIVGSWDTAKNYNVEPPLIALFVGLVISNLGLLPAWLHEGFRVEFYIKLGIVMLGATLPFTLIVWAGPTAILQASIVSIVTFAVIFGVARRLDLDPRLAATLGAGGAICGVSAAIAVAGAVRAKKEHPPIAISLVVFYAIIMIFALPYLARALQLPTGVGGAWIGTSEFADAAGIAAAQAYGLMAGPENHISGTPDQALASYTLIKVIGRDVWIGIWAFVLAYISITRWERSEADPKAQAGQIWGRFPKFVIGFLVASLLVTVLVHSYSLAEYNKSVKPSLIAPITSLRTWAFTLSFLSIGLCTRLKDFVAAGSKPFIAFTAGVIVNLILGYILSVLVFGGEWANIATH